MKTILSIIFIVRSLIVFSQNTCHNDILNGEKLDAENKTSLFLTYDFRIYGLKQIITMYWEY